MTPETGEPAQYVEPQGVKNREAVDETAREIAADFKKPRSILPARTVFSKDSDHSYVISQDDLTRFRHCQAQPVSSYFEIAMGAVLGNLVPTVVSVQKWYRGNDLDGSDLAPLFLMVGFATATVAFWMSKPAKRQDSIESICKEIEARPGTPIDAS